MNRLLLLRVMVLKEVRMLFRERHQIVGLVVAIGIVTFQMFVLSSTLHRELSRAQRHATTQVAPLYAATTRAATQADPSYVPPATMPAVDQIIAQAAAATPEHSRTVAAWIIAAVIGFLSLLGSTVFTTPMAVSTFVGEREQNTMELLLTAPLSDSAIFWLKCLAVLIPTAVLGYLFLGIIALIAELMIGDTAQFLPPGALVAGLLMGAPFPLLTAGVIGGIGAVASIRAQTTRGANQTIGVLFAILFAGFALLGIGGGSLLKSAGLLPGIGRAVLWWLARPLLVQYLCVLALPVLVALIFFALARSLFNREKMLM